MRSTRRLTGCGESTISATCYLLPWLWIACAAAPQTWELGLPSSTSRDQRPIDTDLAEAAQVGREALEKVGYEKILSIAVQAGFLQKYDEVDANASDYKLVTITLEARAFGLVFSRYAVSAGITSQLDSPAPGPADVAALGILVIGLVDAGLLDGAPISFMTARGRVADTGVEEEMQALMNGTAASAGAAALSRCDALDILLEQAHKAGNTALKKKIVATQKFYDCRGSRSF